MLVIFSMRTFCKGLSAHERYAICPCFHDTYTYLPMQPQSHERPLLSPGPPDPEENGHEQTPGKVPKAKGFAAMEPEKRRSAASKGGKTSRGGGRVSSLPKNAPPPPADSLPNPSAKRGFAAMDPEKRRAAASIGGKASRGGGRPPRQKKKTGEPAFAAPKRGFAAMSAEKRKQVASLGGKASQQKGKKRE